MKTAIFILFLVHSVLYSQITDQMVVELNKYVNNVDSLIASSSGAPGEIYSNTINTIRNERAIGIQETKITFYFIQKDDSVYEDNEGTAYFLPRFNPPMLVKIEYNIANSQSVTAKYYINGENYLYNFDSKGAYGNVNRNFWFGKNDLLRFEERSARDEMGVIIESGKFSKEIYSESLNILDMLSAYRKIYYDISEISSKDK